MPRPGREGRSICQHGLDPCNEIVLCLIGHAAESANAAPLLQREGKALLAGNQFHGSIDPNVVSLYLLKSRDEPRSGFQFDDRKIVRNIVLELISRNVNATK